MTASERDRGIIPARAGFTRCRSTRTPDRADHPRSRGVYIHNQSTRPPTGGSSPLARGLRGGDRSNRPHRGIIPARAGFTVACAHVFAPAGGSSPLARGLPAPDTRRPVHWADHPRSRGVYAAETAATAMVQGSSPLARGLLSMRLIRIRSRRIIPARAGFTTAADKAAKDAADHPRSRGVYPKVRNAAPMTSGSSPLARGLRHPRVLGCGDLGIIPARAGFTGMPS